MRRWFLVLAALLLLGLALATAAYAKEIEGTGTLWAKGAGVAVVRGDGEVTIEGCGAAVVIVTGAETLAAQGHGRRFERPRGTIFFGWSGQIYARGEEMAVRMLGGKIEFTTEGTGTAFLHGRGVYIIDGHPGRWSLKGVRLELGGSEE